MTQDKRHEIQKYTEISSREGKRYRTVKCGRVDEIISIFQQMKAVGSRVLELGCGTGTFSVPLLRLKSELVCVDLLDRFLKVVREHSDLTEKLSLVRCDAEDLPFRDKAFDTVFSAYFLHHFHALDKVLDEAFRVLLPGGVLAAIEPNALNPYSWLYHNLPYLKKLNVTDNERLFSATFVTKQLERHNFEVLCTKPINFAFVKNLIRLERILERLPILKRLEGSLVIVAIKRGGFRL